MSSGQNGVEPPETHDSRRGWWATHIRPHLVPVLLGIVPALLITALTPLGEGLRELLFPTRVAVAGTLDLPQGSFPDLELVLDGDVRSTADDAGAFEFEGVPDGNHTIRVDAQGLSDRVIASFSVATRGQDVELQELRVEPAVTLVADGAAGFGSGTSLSLEFILWVEGSAADLRTIEQVEYVAPAWLSPNAPEPTTIRAENFCMHFVLQLESFGSWAQPTARAVFFDGGELVIRMSSQTTPSTATPACATTFEGGAASGGPTLAENLIPPGFGFMSGAPGNSSQAQDVPVPALIGLSVDAASNLIETIGLVPSVRELPSSEPAGTVIAQDPAAFELAERGSTVVITVVTPEEEPDDGANVPVPDVIKLSYPAAVAELKAGGLAAVRAVYEGGCGLKAGDVCEQDPAATGTNNPDLFVEPGTTVTLYVEPDPTPSP